MRAIDKDGAITYRITGGGGMINRSSTIEIVVVEQGWDRDESCNVRIFEIVGRYLRVPALDEYGNFTRFIGGVEKRRKRKLKDRQALVELDTRRYPAIVSSSLFLDELVDLPLRGEG